MSKGKSQYLSSLASGYALMALQILIALAQVPLALSHFGKEQFGIWVLAAQITVWLSMMDIGLNGSLARHVIEYRSKTDPELVSKCIATGFRIFCVQGFFVGLFGLVIANAGHLLFDLEPSNLHSFNGIVLILAFASAIDFPVKVIYSWLYATKRLDLCNKVALFVTLSEFLIFWVLISQGVGPYALAWARLGAAVVQIACYARIAILRTDFPFHALRLPLDRGMVHKLASFGGGMFLITLGSLLLNMTQMALVSKHLGIAYAAIWATAPKLFQVGFQIVSKLWDYRMPYIAALMEDENPQRLIAELNGIIRTSAYLAGAGLGVVAAINPSFLDVWTHKQIHWNSLNDAILATSIFLTLIVRCITELAFQSKIANWMPLITLIEGLMFVTVASWALPRHGITGMLLAAIGSGTLLRVTYALVVLSRRYQLRIREYKPIASHVTAGFVLGIASYLAAIQAGNIIDNPSPIATLGMQSLVGSVILILLILILGKKHLGAFMEST